MSKTRLPTIINRLPSPQVDNTMRLSSAVGSGAAILAGCSDLRPSAKTQTMSLYAIGIPGIAIVTQSTQDADNRGDDENRPAQVNPVTVEVPSR